MENSLYQIRTDHIELLAAIEENEGELTPELEEALSLTQEQFQAKAISYGFVIKKFEDEEAIIFGEIERLKSRLELKQKHQAWLKQHLSDAMIEFGFEKINTPLLSLSFRESTSVEIINEKELPKIYMIEKCTYAPDKKMIKNAILITGRTVPGAQLITKQNLQIK